MDISNQLVQIFPNLLSTGFQITSPQTPHYNCIAWAAGDNARWWWPDHMYQAYWPENIPREATIKAFISAFELLGYDLCDNIDLETKFEKIAIYCDSSGVPTHAARQLSNGEWTSKLGENHDISHSLLDGIAGRSYGNPSVIMKRPSQSHK